ncbi:MAG: 2-alkenal reductase [Thiotrichales bacterium]|nr:MAG: 2-alkenal reductase [Thiotrichales bacterium]
MTFNQPLKSIGVLVGGALLFWGVTTLWSHQAESKTAQSRPVVAASSLSDDELRTIQVFELNSPSVVYISTTQRVVNMWTRNVSERPSGTGTGFVWDDSGHIVTNFHVVSGHRTAKVRLSDQRMFDAAVIGASPEHDLAVLKLLDGRDIPPPVKIGSSHDLRVGQKVLAIGNPFGLDHTLTTGVVSALDRSIDGANNTMDSLIQTDAAINPGNSGGPLLDSSGRLIGVNVAIYSPSGASAGIGFALPVDTVNRVIPKLVQHGRYIRPILGIRMNDDVSRQVSERLDTKGVLVLQVERGSPASRAGIRGTRLAANDDLLLGDLILSIDGKAIEKSSDLTEIMDNHRLNDVVTVRLLRNGSEIVDVDIKLTLQR